MLKILCIGNSFSEDATAYIERMTDNIFVRNLYIGGCSLMTHCFNAISPNPNYEYQKDGEAIMNISLTEALRKEEWDIVTVQQVSQDSGIKETYEPSFSNLLWYIRKNAQKAKIVLHRTWAYESGSNHSGFIHYKKDPNIMFNSIRQTTDFFASKYKLDVIKTGDVINLLTKNGFTKENGTSLYRDGFHLSHEYGRYAAALCWLKFFGEDKNKVTFKPIGADEELLEKIKSLI